MKARTFLNAGLVVLSCISPFFNYGLVQSAEKKLEVIKLDELSSDKKQNQELSLNLTPDMFVRKFNASIESFFAKYPANSPSKKFKKYYLIKNKKIDTGAVDDVFGAKLGANKHNLIGGINKNTNMLIGLSLLLNPNPGDVSEDTVLDDFKNSCRLLMVYFSNLDFDNAKEIISDLLIDAVKNQGTRIKKKIEGIEYVVVAHEKVGLIFVVQPVDN